MLNEKACAIALLDRFKATHKAWTIESQYTKSDTIFYKFKDSNIAVSKRLNHIDFSILSEQEDWAYLLDIVDEDYISNKEYLDSSALEYSILIHNWSEEHSIISKMQKFMNNRALNESGLVNQIKKLESNDKILHLLIDNKLKISDNNNYYRNNETTRPLVDIEMDVILDRVSDNEGNFSALDIVIASTDNNINIVRNTILTSIPEANADQTNRIDLMLGLLIIKYNLYAQSDIFQNHYKTVYKVKYNRSNRLNEDNFVTEHRNSLSNTLSNNHNSNMVQAILFNQGGYYGYSWEIRHTLEETSPQINIDYAAMSDEHLTLFRDGVAWLIRRHAKYIAVVDKEREAFVMFLGRNILEGKKRTKEVLTTHFDLPSMNLEIERRGL